MNLRRTYIDSGAVECYLLGLASAEEEALLHEMRRLYPELESEISVTAFKLEEAALKEVSGPLLKYGAILSMRYNGKSSGNGVTAAAMSLLIR